MLSAEIPSTTNTTIRCRELTFVMPMIILYITRVIGNEKRIMLIDDELMKNEFVCLVTKMNTINAARPDHRTSRISYL